MSFPVVVVGPFRTGLIKKDDGSARFSLLLQRCSCCGQAISSWCTKINFANHDAAAESLQPSGSLYSQPKQLQKI